MKPKYPADGKVNCSGLPKSTSTYNEKGEEIPDPTPLALPINFKAPLSLADQVRRQVAYQMGELLNEGEGALPEDLDTDVEEPEFYSPHEMVPEPSLGREVTKAEQNFIREQRKKFDQGLKEYRKKQKEAAIAAAKAEPAKSTLT